MRMGVSISGNPAELMRAEAQGGGRAVTAGMRWAASTLKARWREDIAGAFDGGARLARTIRDESWPKGQPSLRAASQVWSKAPKIVAAHDEGTLIRAATGYWLAIPLPSAGRVRGGKKITPAEWEKKTGRRLRFVYRRGKSALLVDDGTKASGNVMVLRRRRVNGRRDYVPSEPTTFRNRTIPIFALVPQVKLKKRFDLMSRANEVNAALPSVIVAKWRGER